jgi:hypothetical protein
MKEKKLIPITEYVLELDTIDIPDHKKFASAINYANFLNTPLTLGMFVPVDNNGNVLEEPNFNLTSLSNDVKIGKWREAEKKVLFNVDKVDKISVKIIEIKLRYMKLFYNLKEKYFYYLNGAKIETLLQHSSEITLTENAIKHYGI